MVIKTLANLKENLLSNGIDIRKWGIDGAKTIENLWEEVTSHESEIKDDPLCRVISIVQVIIWNDGQILIEKEQEFQSGLIRLRNRPPSEKMKPGEDTEAAAIRCLVEELGVNSDQIIKSDTSFLPQEKTEDSQSYPGLFTTYIIHRVDMVVRGLPHTDFWTMESERGRVDPIKRHHWIWSKPQKEYSFNEVSKP